ncbi:MAG: hypothetical protein NT061_00050 [Spirochaetes bacterium]|nr:hypothetical protein [Spirochaetota bacterium]
MVVVLVVVVVAGVVGVKVVVVVVVVVVTDSISPGHPAKSRVKARMVIKPVIFFVLLFRFFILFLLDSGLSLT